MKASLPQLVLSLAFLLGGCAFTVPYSALGWPALRTAEGNTCPSLVGVYHYSCAEVSYPSKHGICSLSSYIGAAPKPKDSFTPLRVVIRQPAQNSFEFVELGPTGAEVSRRTLVQGKDFSCDKGALVMDLGTNIISAGGGSAVGLGTDSPTVRLSQNVDGLLVAERTSKGVGLMILPFPMPMAGKSNSWCLCGTAQATGPTVTEPKQEGQESEQTHPRP